MVLRVRTEINGMNGAPWLSTMFFGGDLATGAQAAADAAALFWDAAAGVMDSEARWAVEPFVADVDVVTGEATAVAGVSAANGVGDQVGSVLPLATQMLVQWRTGVFIGGRELRGRTFVPAISQTMSLGSGVPNTSAISLLDGAVQALLNPALPVDLLIWSRTKATTSPVVAGAAWNEFAVLRSRRD